jgi:hypothetical protein
MQQVKTYSGLRSARALIHSRPKPTEKPQTRQAFTSVQPDHHTANRVYPYRLQVEDDVQQDDGIPESGARCGLETSKVYELHVCFHLLELQVDQLVLVLALDQVPDFVVDEMEQRLPLPLLLAWQLVLQQVVVSLQSLLEAWSSWDQQELRYTQIDFCQPPFLFEPLCQRSVPDMFFLLKSQTTAISKVEEVVENPSENGEWEHTNMTAQQVQESCCMNQSRDDHNPKKDNREII